MKKYQIMRKCGAVVGLKFRAASDSQTPEMEFEIIEKGLAVDGFPAVKLLFADGVEETAALVTLDEGIESRGLQLINQRPPGRIEGERRK